MHDFALMRQLCEHTGARVYDGFYPQPSFGIFRVLVHVGDESIVLMHGVGAGRAETLDAIRMFFTAVLVDVRFPVLVFLSLSHFDRELTFSLGSCGVLHRNKPPPHGRLGVS
jgi:hypothetical protein